MTQSKCEGGDSHQQGWRVDVDGLDDCELLLDLPDGGPWPVQLNFDPVTNAAVFSLEGGDQRLLRQLEAEWKLVSASRKDGNFTII